MLEQCSEEEATATARWGTKAASRYQFLLNFLTCIDMAGDLGRFAFLDLKQASRDGGGDRLRWTLSLGDGWHLALETVEGEDAFNIMEVYRRD
jgi:hypothetical protein